ncbi:MAG: hypothetical protein J7K85_08885 [Anaerolineaceae bacterium]|nr:hypothetical protein [Anaerolineaceae bacterium]
MTDKQKEFYQYDPVGNRITSSEHKSYSHNNGNELLSADHRKYTYDTNGNRTSKTTSAGITTYVWDYENRLKKVINPCGKTISFTYDPFGRRISKTVNGVTTSYTYDSEDILFETTAGKTGNIYIHGPGIHEPLALLGHKGTTYYHADGLGSIVAMTDDQARNVQQYKYDSFGNQHDMKNRIKQPYGYTGREHDRETGLYYYRARYYDPEVGRFISEDPIGFAGGDVNLYGYVVNDPISLKDPYGLDFATDYTNNLDITNRFFFDGSTKIARTALGTMTSGATARTVGTVTAGQAIRSLFQTPAGIATLGGVSGTLAAAGANTVVNSAGVVIFLEGGIGFGSLVNAIPVYGTDQSIGDWWVDTWWEMFNDQCE